MTRALLALLLLLPVLAQAAPAYRSSSTSANAAAASIGCGDPAGSVAGDLHIALVSMSDEAGATTKSFDVPSGWTQITQNYASDANMTDLRLAVLYRIRGASAPGTSTWTYDDGVSYTGPIRCTISAYSGVRQSSPLDVAFSEADHRAVQVDALNFATGWVGGPPGDIDTVSKDAFVVLVQFLTTNGTLAAPSGYTLDYSIVTSNRGALFASKSVAAVGNEAPGVWGHTGITTGADAVDFTLAIRSAHTPDFRRRRK